MTTIQESATDEGTASTIDLDRVEEFAHRIQGDQAIANNAALAYLGDRLGLWRSLASVADTTSVELAERTGLAERYLREWLAAQAAAGYVLYEPATGRFSLPAEHAAVLADDDSLAAMAAGFEFGASVWASIDRIAHAYASGEGIGWHEHDPALFSSTERFFRPLYAGSLIEHWLPSIGGLVERLQQGIRVLDVGCGLGTATVMLAREYPASTFTGVDYHEESVRRATLAATRAGVSERVRFEQTGAQDYSGGPYDLICFFDALHDMGDPVGALVHAATHLADGGVLMAVEPAAADRLEDNLHSIGLAWYVASATVCVPGSLSQPGAAALGTQAGPSRLIEVFNRAGFDDAHQAGLTPFNQVIAASR